MERKIDQILSSGEGSVNRLFAVIDELLESEAYPSMQILFTRVLGDSVPQQVTSDISQNSQQIID